MPIPENNPLQKSDPNPPKEVQHSNPYSSGGNFFSDLIRGPKLPDNIADLKKKEEIKKTEPVKEDWFKDRSLFHKSEIDQFFKNPKLRSELRQELGFSSTDEKKLREKIEYIKKIMPDRIEKSAASHLIKKQDTQVRKESSMPYETADWMKEKKERDINKKTIDFLKKKLGI